MSKTPFPTTPEGVRRRTRIARQILDALKAAEQEGLLEHFEFGPGLQTEVSQYDDALEAIQGKLDAGLNASDKIQFTRYMPDDADLIKRDADRAYEDQLVAELEEAGITEFIVREEETHRKGKSIHITLQFNPPITVTRLQRAYDEFGVAGKFKLVGERTLMDSEV